MSNSPSGLAVRRPKFDFDRVKLLWSKNQEFAMMWNAASTSAPHIEPYLNQVMMKCKAKLGNDHRLAAEIDHFVKQESTHYQMHALFNQKMYDLGYDISKPLEMKFRSDFKELLSKRSLAFNAAYCSGFENFTLFSARFIFETADDLFEDADPTGAGLFLWHLAEEFEHRSVCHDVFAAVSGNYFLRIYGLLYSYKHLNGYIASVVKLYLAKFRAGMTEAEAAASIKREKAYIRRYMLFALPRMLAILLPFYDPGKAKAHRKLEDALTHYAAMSA